jgi:hypothetical protein
LSGSEVLGGVVFALADGCRSLPVDIFDIARVMQPLCLHRGRACQYEVVGVFDLSRAKGCRGPSAAESGNPTAR